MPLHFTGEKGTGNGKESSTVVLGGTRMAGTFCSTAGVTSWVSIPTGAAKPEKSKKTGRWNSPPADRPGFPQPAQRRLS